MRIFKAGIKVAAFCALVFVVNSMFSFALEPMRGASDVMWSDYEKEENLDMIYAGSSFCLRAFNPYIIDEILGTNSYNMGTPAQAVNQTYVAVKTAIEEHEIGTVVLAINYSSLESDWPEGAKVAFMQAKGENESFFARIKDTLSFMLDEDNREECTSVNFLFPWIYNHVSIDKQSILDNINAKLTAEADFVTEEANTVYLGKGFGYYTGQIDCNTIGNKNSKTLYTNEFSTAAFEAVEEIALLCRENDVELIAINVPRPVLDVISYGPDYFVKQERLELLFQENGAEYYDFNLIKPEIMELKDEYFADVEHFNEEGANVFSAAFAEFLSLQSSGENLEKYFYTAEEYLNTVDYITNIYFEAQPQEDGVAIKMYAYHGNDVNVEYEVSLWDSATDTYTILREYSKNDAYLFQPEQPGTYHICVKARKVGESVAYDRLYKMEVRCE